MQAGATAERVHTCGPDAAQVADQGGQSGVRSAEVRRGTVFGQIKQARGFRQFVATRNSKNKRGVGAGVPDTQPSQAPRGPAGVTRRQGE